MGAKSTTTQERIGRIGQRRQDDSLTPAEAKAVRRGEAQLKRGQSKPWRAVKHALGR